MDIIEIENACKLFGDTCALRDINITFEEHKIHGIIGRNGSGKTVLLKCLCGLMALDSGEIFVDGNAVGKKLQPLQDTGAIIEAPGFLPNHSGYHNLKILSHISGNKGKSDIKGSMETVGLDADSKKWVGKYSLGMRQRLGIAQAIMDDPRLLILDEPMNGLDNKGVQEMRNLFLSYRDKGKTILLTSHNSEDISLLCDTVTEMDNGQVIRRF